MVSPEEILSDQKGVAAVQYALVAGVLSLVVLAGSLALREPVIDLYDGMANQANGALAVQPSTGPLP